MLSYYEQLKDWALEDDMRGFDCLGADPVVTIPTVGANYTDAKTVAAVQTALVRLRYDIGKSGVDGIFGRDTRAAIIKMQGDAGLEQTGKIDEGVIMALKVTPGVLPPGVTIQGKAAVQAQVALDAATAAVHAGTAAELQKAAQDTIDAANAAQPPLPPETLQAARDALTKSKQVTTPAQVQAVKQQVQQAAQTVATKVAPNWWMQPAWAGGWERWKVASVGAGGVVGLGALFAWLVSSGAGATAAAAVGIGAATRK